jgi:hypothetical protein
MQQFTVPQFIDVEDKIIGPITARQFIIMLSGFMLMAVCYKLLTFNLFLVISILIFAMTGILAFFKVNGMPFHFFVLNFFQTATRPSTRVWNHEYGKEAITEEQVQKTINFQESAPRKTLPTSRLNQQALIVDTQGAYQGDEEESEEKILINR